MNRRGFLQTCLAFAAAPAIVRADSLMRIVPLETNVLTSVSVTSAGSAYLSQAIVNFAAALPAWLVESIYDNDNEPPLHRVYPLEDQRKLGIMYSDADIRTALNEWRAVHGKPDPMLDRVEVLQKIRRDRKAFPDVPTFHMMPMSDEIKLKWVGGDGTFTYP